MAILKHISVKNRFYSDAVEYLTCQFDEYTNKPVLDEKGRVQEREHYLIEGVHCEPDTFGAECIEVNRRYGKNNSVKDVKAHHYIISFDPNDRIDMEQAMEFGKQWLSVFAPGHQAVIAVHPDGHNRSRNMHIHIVINSVRKYEGKRSPWHDKQCEWRQGCKHKSTGKMMYHAKKWIMEKCIRMGYEQVNLLAKKHTDNYWVEKRLMKKNCKDGAGVTSNRELIRNTIDKMLPLVNSFEQMTEYLRFIYGWEIRITKKTVTFAMPDMKKGIRGNKLGEGYGKAELEGRIAQLAEAKKEAERMRKIAEEAAKEEARIKARQEEIRLRKRKLAMERNRIQQELYGREIYREDWNKEYVYYLQTQYISDSGSMTEEELKKPILTREEFEAEQMFKLYQKKAEKAGVLWSEALRQLSGIKDEWKWAYMGYLEDIKYKEKSEITMTDITEEIMGYEEYVAMKKVEEEKEREKQIDYTELSVKERAAILPVPTDDYQKEYKDYCQRMGYTKEKMQGTGYVMALYDEFMEEYDYRKRQCGEKYSITRREKYMRK